MDSKLDNIPAEFRDTPHWVNWKYEEREGKRTKVPYIPLAGGRAKANDEKTWRPFGVAIRGMQSDGMEGIGFVVTKDDAYIGVDLDDCITNGELSPEAQSWIDACPTYTEITPSGKGLRLYGLGHKPQGFRNTATCEVYESGRFFCMTGQKWEGTPDTINPIDLSWAVPTVAERPARAPEVQPLDDAAQAVLAMAKLDARRVDIYDEWLQVGMALHELGELGLSLWDEWSKKSPKYEWGKCAEKWQTFTSGEGHTLTLKALLRWASDDASGKMVPPCPRNPRPSDYIAALGAMGYNFALNLMNDEVFVNGRRQDDISRAVLVTELREHGYNNPRVGEDAWVAESAKTPFHPIRDYLGKLVWDGGDHIGKMCQYFDGGTNTAFNTFVRRWLVGAVARPMAGPNGVQARVFVLDGKQGIGKSRWVRWLGSPLPSFFTEGAINTEDKDFLIYLAATWIWEVAELGSTLRKSDREALKHYLSRQTVRVRKPYGRMEIIKPAIASFVATINDEGGFLSDPTGHRRWMVATIKAIDWAYEKEVNVNQVWAQAALLYRDGEPWELTSEESLAAEDISQGYEIADPLYDHITEFFVTDALQTEDTPGSSCWFMPTQGILLELKEKDRIREAGRRESMAVSSILTKMGLQAGQRRTRRGRMRGYYGIQKRGP